MHSHSSGNTCSLFAAQARCAAQQWRPDMWAEGDALEEELLQLLSDAGEHVAGRGGVQINREASPPAVEAELRHGSRHAGRRMNGWSAD